MADLAKINYNLVVLESARSEPQFREMALLLAEDAQVFAGAIELLDVALSPAEAIRFFARKLRDTARRLTPAPTEAGLSADREAN